jgi:hypothetical protein
VALSEREAFECYARSRKIPLTTITVEGHVAYEWDAVEKLWQGWQAYASSSRASEYCKNCYCPEMGAAPCASSSRAEVESASFEIRVDGMRMAATDGPRERALSEAQRYFSQYTDEGEVVELVEVIVLAAAEAPKEGN